MISVSSNDARRDIGLGFGGMEEEIMMKESEFDEESTHFYVSCVDPDVALSYIDEKIENVLGHFQKDFEGLVSAENLGPKYGCYGSFLAMYQRSHVCKSPSQVQNQVVSQSKCSASSDVPQVSVSGSTSKAPHASDVLVKLSNIGTPDSKQKSVTKPSSSSSAPANLKTLRLRIKVGLTDLSSLKKVSTYNSNSLSEVEEGFHDSPTRILMAMVSFPLHEDEMLSPLSDDLIQLGKKEKILKDVGVGPERELSGTCKKPKTGKSRFSSVDQPGSNKVVDGVKKTRITQASAQKVKDIAKASSHDGHEDKKRKHREDKENGDCMRLKEATVMESSGEKVRKKKRLKGSSCDRDRLSQENGRDSASHLRIRASSPSLLGSEISKTNVHEAKGSLVDSLAPSVLEPRELKLGRNSEGDEHHDTDSSAGDMLKRYRDGTTKKVAESSKDDLGTAVEVKTKESRSKKRPARKVSMESNKEGSREYQDPNSKLDTNGSHFCSPQKYDRAKTIHGKSNHLGVTVEKLKNKSAPRAGTDQVEVLGHGTETSNTKKQNQKKNGRTHKDDLGSSPLKKESKCQTVSNSIKEATDLKHMADRLKNGGSNHESTGVYFQAALKFLHGAFLLESSGTEHATHKSIARSKHIYGSTAKLCEFCAHEYEKNKDMGAAALAYKCMEVAYLRITYSSYGNISRYRSELQAALQVIPSGESPSFASDGENSNQTLAAEKVALSNTVRSSPKVTGNHVLSSGNNSSLSQLLAFSQTVSFAMDASRKAQIAFAVAKGKSSDTRYSSNWITSIKRALDFSFQDMEKLLHVVRLAMESINR